MKAVEQYFTVVLFIMLYKVALSSLWVKTLTVAIQMKAVEQSFPKMPFMTLNRVVLYLLSLEMKS